MILTLQWIWSFIVTQTTPMILLMLGVFWATGFLRFRKDDKR